MHAKDVDVSGSGYFQFGRYPGTGTPGVVNILSASEIIIDTVFGNDDLVMGTINNPDKVLIRLGPLASGLIDTTAPTGSPYTYTNNDSCMECVYLVGGTISDVTRGGQSLGAERVHYLAPGDSIGITYADALTIRRCGIS